MVRVHPYGALTVGEQGEVLADLAGLAPHVVAFSDDGRGVQSESMMRQAMLEAKRLGKVVAAHCEDNRLLRGGYIHDGVYAGAMVTGGSAPKVSGGLWPGLAPGQRDRLRLPRVPRLGKGDRGPHPPGQGGGTECHL